MSMLEDFIRNVFVLEDIVWTVKKEKIHDSWEHIWHHVAKCIV